MLEHIEGRGSLLRSRQEKLTALRARARGKNNAALPLECRKMDLHPVITGFLLAIIFAAFLIVGFVSSRARVGVSVGAA